MIETGEKIPKFKLADQSEKEKTFKDISGKNGTVIYAYPRDNTPGCTTEANDFQANLDKFEALGLTVVGISKDSVKSHCNFTEKYGLNFSLLSDPDKELLEPLGAWGEKKNYGKVSMGTIRSTFVFDSKGKLQKAYRNVRAKGHVDRLLKDIAE